MRHMSRCKKPCRGGPPPVLPIICAAFGAGILLALCSLRLVLLLAAAFLITLGLLAAER